MVERGLAAAVESDGAPALTCEKADKPGDDDIDMMAGIKSEAVSLP